MTITTWFCPVCGAANDVLHTRCFACGHSQEKNGDGDDSHDGPLLRERYRLGAQLGAGGFSAVYRAWDVQEGGRLVAIKQISLQGLAAEEVIEATDTFNREVAVLSTLDHPQVPRIYDHFSDQDRWYLVLEYIEGQTLETYLETHTVQKKQLPLDEILALALQLCTVLDYLHSRQPPIIFRDLKPGNIMRTLEGKLCLIDFGIARRFTPGQARDTQPLGSPGYAAPEQYGRAQTTSQADIYSLGALLHQLLSEQDPSQNPLGLPPLRLHRQPGSAELEALVRRMLALNPRERPASIHVVAQVLEQVKQQRGTPDARRIWLPPVPQEYPSSGGQPFQTQMFAQPIGRAKPISKRGYLTRRRALMGLGALIATMAGGGAIWRMNTALPSPSHTSPGSLIYTGSGSDIAWSPGSTYIVSTFPFDTTLQVWDAVNGNTLITRQWESMLGEVAWSPDGQFIAAAADHGTVPIWQSTHGGLVLAYQKKSKSAVDTMNTVAWSPDSQHVASACYDKTAQVWNVPAGITLVIYTGHTDQVVDATWSPDGQRIATASWDNTAQIWNAMKGKKLLAYQKHMEAVNTVAWSPDGTSLASASDDGTVQIWDATTGKTLLTYVGHKSTVKGAAWSPNGKYIASASQDKTVQVWHAASGDLLFTYTGHTDTVYTVKWSPNGRLIASADANAIVQVWAAPE